MFSIKMKRAFAKKNGKISYPEVDKLPTPVLIYFQTKLAIYSPEHDLILRIESDISKKIDYNI
ncbi:MAG: hypothetical protein NTZ20_05280 [Candidatus Levybacteria bacterium]|nr:hypothetical protein [Candidatus Levybacteria bacterium]